MANSKFCILIVDDSPENIDLLRGLLGDEYKIKVALNGPRAIELAQAEPQPDLILLDIVMPDMDGYQVCEQLKSEPKLAHIDVIFLTAKTTATDEQKGLKLGASDYITKPFDPEVVKTRISSRLDIVANERKLRQQIEQLTNQQQVPGNDNLESGLLELLSQGESESLEFKSTLRKNLYTNKNETRIENQCLKSVAAFLNGEGGDLFVGVDDDGQPVGLESDGFQNDDKMLLHWHNLLREYLGADMAQSVRSNIKEITGQKVMHIKCTRSPRPVFLRRDNEESFYVRMGNSSQALKPSEMLSYVDSRYGSVR